MRSCQVLFLTVLLAIACTAGHFVSAQDDDNSQARIEFQQKLEESLTNNKTAILLLQDLFLYQTTQNTKDCYTTDIVIEVGQLNANCTSNPLGCGPFINCSGDPSFTWLFPDCKRGSWITGRDYYVVCPNGLSERQTTSGFMGHDTKVLLEALDPLFYAILSSFSNTSQTFVKLVDGCYSFSSNTFSPYVRDVDIPLWFYIEKLELLPSPNDTYNAEFRLLSLAKGYARTNGNLAEIQYKDISTVIDTDNYDTCNGKELETWVIVIIFYSLNLLVLGAVMRFLPQSLQWLYNQDKQKQSLYGVTAVILILVNLVSFIVHLANPGMYKYFLRFVLPIIIFLLLIEVPFVIYHTWKRHSPQGNSITKRILAFSLNFLACCNIIWFIHRLVTDAFIAILNFIFSPAQTVGVVTMYLATIAIAIKH